MAKYINKEELIEQYPELDGYTFADVPTIDIVRCKDCKYRNSADLMCGNARDDWFCADAIRKE